MGWAMLVLIALLAAAALVALGVRRPMWTAVAAALVLGAAGYAWQGAPGVPGSRAAPRKDMLASDPGTIALRDALFGRFDTGHAYFVLADALVRAGEPRLAAHAMIGAVNAMPGNAAMWTGLGSTVAIADGDQMSPTARFAFARAHQLAPQHPGPLFFRGVARLRGGDFAGARGDWAAALALCPRDVSYRASIAERLALLDKIIALQAGEETRESEAKANPGTRSANASPLPGGGRGPVAP